MQLHKDLDFLLIHWDDSIKSVVMTWKKFARGDHFRNGLNEGVNLIKEKGGLNWLADLRDLGTVTNEDQQWSNEDWYPRAIAAGIRYMAIIMPKSYVSTLSVKNILTKVEDIEIETQYFDSVEEAKHWLGGKR